MWSKDRYIVEAIAIEATTLTTSKSRHLQMLVASAVQAAMFDSIVGVALMSSLAKLLLAASR